MTVVKTSFWYDPWHPDGRLIDKYGNRPIYDMGMGAEIRVADVLSFNRWVFPFGSTHELQEIFQKAQNSVFPNDPHYDEVVWTASESGNFSMKHASVDLVTHELQLPLANCVWFSGCIKKHSVCLWFAMRNGLKTKSLLLQRNIQVREDCAFCNREVENVMHLFVHCSYSSAIWADIELKFYVGRSTSSFNSLEDVVQHLMHECDHSAKDNITLAKLYLPARL